MSIIIQNMGGPPNGVCRYELRINRDTVAEFTHDRRNGLAICLMRAAEAVQEKQREQLAKMMGMK